MKPDLLRLRVLLVEDNDDHAALFHEELAATLPQAPLTRVSSLGAAKEWLAEERVDLVFLDLGLPESQGLGTLDRFLELGHRTPVIVITSQGETEIGVEALKLGAADFLDKAIMEGPSLLRAALFAIERDRAHKELARKQRMLQTFVAAAGHDLQTPLANIEGLIEALVGIAEGRLDAEALGLTDAISGAAGEMRGLLHDMLVFARVGTAEQDMREVALSALVDRVLAMLPTEDRARVLRDEEATLRCDPGQMHFVLQNLITNGLKYWEGTPSTVRIGVRETSGDLRITVADDGIGVPQDLIDKIFQPGVRGVDGANFSGTGFGLAICREVVEAHGGRIWATSGPDGGATFTFTLPH
ncbi:MAG: hybrid sensor histidine kinase/response regulator [Pseudomonadota bacterium]